MMTLAYAPDQGNGASKSHIIFAVTSAQPSSLKCGTPISADFWHSECTSSSKGRHCWTDVTQYTNTSPSVNDCCLKCKANAACNGFTHQHQSGPQGWICGLKSCYDETGSPVEDCLTTPRPNSTVQSALIAGRKRHIVTAAVILRNPPAFSYLKATILAEVGSAVTRLFMVTCALLFDDVPSRFQQAITVESSVTLANFSLASDIDDSSTPFLIPREH